MSAATCGFMAMNPAFRYDHAGCDCLKTCERTSNGEPCFIRTVRVKPGSIRDDLSIDFHEYGKFDLIISARRVTASIKDKPLYKNAPWDAGFCPPLPKR